jgi:hypothetical protein
MQKISSYDLKTPWNIAYRFHQSRFLRRKEGRLWVLRAIRLLKTSFPRLRQYAPLNAQNVENGFEWPFDIFKHRIDITKVEF